MNPPEEVAAGPVVLRRWRTEWSSPLLAAVQASLPELRSYMAWATDDYGSESAEEFVRETTRGWEQGTGFSYAMWSRAGELVGAASLMTRLGPGVLEIGYWVHSAHTGRGYATAAAQALTQVGLSVDAVEKVVIRHDAGNLASATVARRAGFTEVERRPSTLDEARDGTGVEVVWERSRA